MQLKHTVVALAAAGLLSAQAHAGEMQVETAIQPAQTVAAFTDADLQALFEASDKPMQLAALSQQEMRETEGALWVFNALGGAVGGIAGLTGYINQNRNPTPLGALSAFGLGALTGAIAPGRVVSQRLVAPALQNIAVTGALNFGTNSWNNFGASRGWW